MTHTFTLPESLALRDLQVFLGRAGRVEDGSARLIVTNGVLAVYVAIFYPVGLLDQAPTVLGLRTLDVGDTPNFDAVVPVGSLLERINRKLDQVADDAAPVTVTLPMEVHTVTWAAISPPRGGWRGVSPTTSALLGAVAKSGIEEVAEAIPTGTGEQIVHRVRSEVWGRPIEGLEHVPAGGAFAALSLGFLSDSSSVEIYETGPWTRLTTDRGHVLIKRKAWTLSR
ncbi:hypothetical protein B0I08_101203 [Glaciihabitans tibetensis]|uniref:Uncharacterized protein n=1 Tax=Glaciihabitans tibetensis TaxID=1266600 RepID=A0A2T0VIN9_9MICO|nr:hypothetical protein [Glaciihabitans tibetensis]PRY70078.1 hypothetical protein B0I08_101203 [Glaciihabitans tibetensis]